MPDLNQLLADLTSGDELRAEAAAVQFVQLGEPAFTALEKLCQDSDPDIHWWALRALSEFSGTDTSPIFIKALTDPNPEIQSCAALSLRHHPDPKAIPKLIALLGHPDKLLSRLAGDALIAHGFQATKGLINLIESSDNHNQLSRVEAVRALAAIQDPGSISTLFTIYQEGSSMMQHWAEEGLSNMGIGMVFFDPN
jgi:HEAT repeat protein